MRHIVYDGILRRVLYVFLIDLQWINIECDDEHLFAGESVKDFYGKQISKICADPVEVKQNQICSRSFSIRFIPKRGAPLDLPNT